MVILDDCSRYVVGWGLMDTKHSSNTAAVLENALRRFGPIAFFFTDNGTEFKGELTEVARKHDIMRLFTCPRNPEQNGKVKRFWPLFEKSCNVPEDIPKFMESYNRMVHMGLNKFARYQPTPLDMYRRNSPWARGQKAMWEVDGVLIEMPGQFY